MKAGNELLVIIDPQKDFTSKTGVYAKKHQGITQLSGARDKIISLVTSQKKSKIVIVYSNYAEEQFEKGLSLCIPGTVGHDIDLDIDSNFTLIPKNNHSCFSSEVFINYLKENDVGSLLLCGFLAEYCVKQTAIDGLKNGYQVSLLKDCIGTGDDVQERKEKVLMELAAMGATILEDNY